MKLKPRNEFEELMKKISSDELEDMYDEKPIVVNGIFKFNENDPVELKGVRLMERPYPPYNDYRPTIEQVKRLNGRTCTIELHCKLEKGYELDGLELYKTKFARERIGSKDLKPYEAFIFGSFLFPSE